VDLDGAAFAPDSLRQQPPLTMLVYELLDAHADTARLVDESAPAAVWDAHLDYLRGLQRVSRALLARLEARS
jgi:hypothetical protein